jgi:hypothetical protein
MSFGNKGRHKITGNEQGLLLWRHSCSSSLEPQFGFVLLSKIRTKSLDLHVTLKLQPMLANS